VKLKTLLWLVSLAFLWGIAFLFVQVAVRDIPPLTLVTARVGLGAAILYIILRAQGRNLPRLGPIWVHFAVMGLLYNAAPYVLLAWGQQHIDSALAAVFIGLTPLVTMVLAHLFTRDDHFTPAKMVGVGLGFAGLLALLGPALLAGVQATLLGLLAALGAAISYGAAIVYGKQTLQGLPPLVGPTAQLAAAAIGLAPLSLLLEQPYMLPLPSWPALSALLMLAVLSTALAFYIYYRAMESTSASTLGMAGYMVPVVATIAGVLVLKERLDWNAYAGFALILAGVLTVNGVLKFSGLVRAEKRAPRPGSVSAR
jgi:drug/metabolite transporter (DMT)-like permease